MNLKQPRTTSLNESLLNTGSGFALSLLCQWCFLVWVKGLPMTWGDNLEFAGIMTVVSVLRGFAWRRWFEARRISFALSPFLLAVLAERQRQIDVEGYPTSHDDKHSDGDLAAAAAAYLYAGSLTSPIQRERLPRWYDKHGSTELTVIKALWRWDWEFWKPKVYDRRRDLVRGVALGLAEGEKFERKRRQPRGAAGASV